MPLGDGPNAWREPGEPVVDASTDTSIIDLDERSTEAPQPLDDHVEGYNALEPEPMTPRERRNSWREVVQHVT